MAEVSQNPVPIATRLRSPRRNERRIRFGSRPAAGERVSPGMRNFFQNAITCSLLCTQTNVGLGPRCGDRAGRGKRTGVYGAKGGRPCATRPLGHGSALSLFAPSAHWEARWWRKGTRVTCLRCQLEVLVTTDNGGLELSYDFERWSKRCCCANLSSPADCCSIFGIQDMLNKLPRPPKG